jgi:methyltransferase (TIGR00027 family)
VIPNMYRISLVFDDPLAVAMAAGELGVDHALPVARRRHAESELNAAISRGATQYVILGAGLDTYAYRHQNSNLRIFEVGHPATQAWKRTRLAAAGIAIPPSLAFVPAGFEEQLLAPALADAGFRAGEVSFFSWLGVSLFASAQATLDTLAFIGSLPARSGVVLDYAVRRASLGPAEETAMDALASRLAGQDQAPELLVDSEALDELLKSAGFGEVEDLGPAEIDRRYFSHRTDGLRMPPGLVHLVTARV